MVGLMRQVLAAVWFTGVIMAVLGLPAIAEDLDVTAKSFVIMDAKTGQLLLAYNPHALLPPASTLKVMTAMYVREKLDLDDQVPISAYAAAAPPSKINVKTGETYTVKELLYALLLSSANDGARALAERVSGSEATFAQELTQKVRQWGAYRTTLTNANGLPSEYQYSCTQDLATLFRRAVSDPVLAEIMATKYYNIRGDRELRNHDRFLFTTPMAAGGKTGFTRASKHTYVGRFRQGDSEIIVAMMGSQKKWADLRELIQRGFAANGAPIAKMEPLEEKLRFARKHLGNSVGTGKSKSRLKRRSKRVVMGSLATMPEKKKRKNR